MNAEYIKTNRAAENHNYLIYILYRLVYLHSYTNLDYVVSGIDINFDFYFYIKLFSADRISFLPRPSV